MALYDQTETSKEEQTDMHRSKLFCVCMWIGTWELNYICVCTFTFSCVLGVPDPAHQCVQVPGEEGVSPGYPPAKVRARVCGLLLNSLRHQL